MTLSVVPKSVLSLSKSILILSVLLAFAAFTPAAFAQRGGGSHGGGHMGGGHVGGVRGGFTAGSARGASSVMRGSAAAGRTMGSSGRFVTGGVAGVAPERTSTRGFSRNTFVPASPMHDGNSASHFVPVMSQSFQGTHAFAANNRFWEDPPQQGRTMAVQTQRPMPRPMTQPMTRPMTQALSRPFVAPATPLMRVASRPIFIPMPRANSFGTAVARPMVRPLLSNPARLPVAKPGTPFVGMTVQPVVIFSPFVFNPVLSNPAFFFRFHPIGGCFTAFNCFGFGRPFFNPFFFGFGFGPCFTGGIGCGFGPFSLGDLAFGDFGGGGFGNGWFYPPAPEVPAPPVNPTENAPLNFAPNYYFMPEVPAETENVQKPTVKLVLKDGTIFDVYSYWLENNQLFYITTYNIKTSIPIDDLDLQKTVDLNQKLGVTFTLSNKPPDQQQPPQQQPEQPE